MSTLSITLFLTHTLLFPFRPYFNPTPFSSSFSVSKLLTTAVFFASVSQYFFCGKILTI